MSETLTTSVDPPANSPGAVLKRCREYHDISLEEASQTTKIGISYLKSLEEDQISGFANLTYLKGFLRIYATYLGLNPDDMARMYDKQYGAKDGKGTTENTTANNGRPSRSLISLQKLALPAAILLLILIAASLFKHQPAATIRPPQPAASNPVATPATAVQTILTSAKIATAAPVIEESKAKARKVVENVSDKLPLSNKPAESGKAFILKIRVIQNGSLNVEVDGSGAQSYELTIGDIIEWKAEKVVVLDLSNAGGVAVELNGNTLKQLGPAGKPAYIVLDANGIKL